MSTALQELLNTHRWQIYQMVHDRVPLTNIAQAMPFLVSYSTVYLFIRCVLHMQPKAKRESQDTAEFRERRAEIIRLREGGASYRQISKRFSIGHQRVAQILKKHTPELMGRAYFWAKETAKNPWPTITCKQCGAAVSAHSRSRAATQKFCSRRCARTSTRGEIRSKPSKERRLEIIAFVNEKRREKWMWSEIANFVGYESAWPFACGVRRWGEQFGIDMTDSYTQR